MKKITVILLTFAICIATSYAYLSGEQLLKSLQNNFNSLDDISAEFQQLTNGNVNLSGKLYFKKPENLRLEIQNVTIVSDGVTNWNYNKKQNKVLISNYDSSNPSIFSLNNFVNKYPSKCNVSSENVGGEEILILKPRDNSLNFTSAKIWLNHEQLIKQIKIKATDGSDIEVKFYKYKINPKLSKSTFTFTPPEGSNVIDLR